MPHKRAKASVRNATKDKRLDLPATSDKFSDTPGAFKRLMKAKEFAAKKAQVKKAQKEEGGKEAAERNIPQIRPGERMKAFSQRVEEEMRGTFLKSVRESKPVTERKRKYRDNKKERERAKKQSKLEDRTDDWGKLRDDVKFGEVADAPPILKSIPKARGAAKKALEAKSAEAMKTTQKDGYQSEEDENMKMLKASHKRKLSNLSLASRKALDVERERAIKLYRMKKAQKMQVSGLTPLV
ncbi:hypothetical protein K450DRAFT_225324 [Umbelopsis ramanniana AG]|uniref:Uncharacterized protein n=1 Tax=Umbelopsis ramanniana AG TaxID=1314678 RepID=A0AAD5EFH2_UMBRA|nr:uncharacterized protein K450DRAFT_225324 [Umbelopsis ramanniana AG]KAI8582891.1 hypothetical protein K450DRAFT_225324 [Umbelopsis ramanniana AG]